MPVGDLLKWLPPVLVVLGWIVVNWQNDKRELRKEARSLIDAAKKLVGEIAVKAVNYHVDGQHGLTFEIKAGLDALEIECERLPYFVKDSPLMGAHVAFTDAITGGDFEATAPAKKAPNSPEVATILRTRTEMLAELERVFRVHHLGRGGSRRPWG
ncbi:MAG: hypothetical protein JO171_00905 [Paludibacterium sp.]|uniref:hypothetical protein n=1 Tax=Paludibacterium sp. TaxID=1917523 RepID=UPI0025ECF141|nr:hypothetical protein [Paludibacterium sp.]MBV8045683.1 hypothetical protein [Paludibacterium sp.]